MKNFYRLWIVWLLSMFLTSNVVFASEEINDDALLAALALNYSHASLCKIISYNDRIVLEEEYNNIINNINLTKINDDQVISILMQLMDTISQYRMNDGDKERFMKIYEKQVSNAFYSSYSGVSNIIVSGGGNPYAMAAMAFTQIGGAYANYRSNLEMYRQSLDQKTWQLEKDTITVLNDVRKVFLL